ncbi:mothers against decapentaplegic homolog 6-like [Orbicella faveolata]|uniref:mothers against decapentaplegic homolog 6-like n=1 Tax=Orbicella faveolata TaxID=48498 RepID=UPI0009E20AF2|nr:mothers against decapentaplegic homolog 6-like [Orbicella faveolata]
MRICQLLTCCLDVQACDVIKELRSFLRFLDHANLSDRLDVIAKYKCVAYMFKLLRLVSKLSALENYFVPTGRKDFSPEESAELKSVTHSILKRLHEKEFSTLQRALESRGGLETTCVFFPTQERLGRQVVVEPQLVLFRVFRLPQVRSSAELKRSSCCSTHNGLDKKVCINPYHYSAIMNTGQVSAIYTTLPSTMEVKNEESSGFTSNLTQSTTCPLDCRTSQTRPASQTLGPDYCFSTDQHWSRPWCSIAYWEQSERIGPSFEGTTDVINVFETLPEPSGFCLAALNRRTDVPDRTKRVRAQIGYGLQLTREKDGIWIYNRSGCDLFANGPTLTYSNEKCPGGKTRHNILVHKVPPGYSLKVYDYNNFTGEACRAVDSAGVRCYHPESVRISFKKGWGVTSSAQYCRPLVTSCPCWIEVHLFVSR